MGSKNIEKLTKCIVKIHLQNIERDNFKIYNSKWVTEQISQIEDNNLENDIVLALKTMFQVETNNPLSKKINFLAWDIDQGDWQKHYKSGKVGSYVWDIACIINFVNDSKFSEMFLESYFRHGGEKPTLTILYANLYYVKVVDAIKNKDFKNLIEITREIIDNAMFITDIISYETLTKLNITGY